MESRDLQNSFLAATHRNGFRDRDDILFVHVNEWALAASSDSVPISEAYILAHLAGHGFSGSVLGDLKDRPLRPGQFARFLKDRRPRVLAFSAYQENIERVRLWARYARSLDRKLFILLGGPQTTFMPGEALLQASEFDCLCRGEGEAVALGITNVLAKGSDPASVPGIAFRRGGEIVETAPVPGPEDLDSYASPYLLDLVRLEGKSSVILLTSRGCAFPCNFCYTPAASGRRVRFHSIGRVIAEMEHLRDRGIRDFWFADPNFAHSPERLGALLTDVIRTVPQVGFWCQMRCDRVTPELLAELRRAGAHTVAFGLESACPEILARLNKKLDVDRLSRVIRWTHEQGIGVELFTMFGLPGETYGDAMKTMEFVRTHRVPIEGNSICQQLHLFFGARTTEDPEGFGIRPRPWTRPAYLSVCRDYETDAMPHADMEAASLAWRINRTDFVEDVLQGRNLFERARYLTRYAKALARRPEARCLLARIYLALEEYEAAAGVAQTLLGDFPGHPQVEGLVFSPCVAFRNSRAPAASGCKVVFDCHGYVDGALHPATVSRFQTAVLGNGELLPDFERGLLGLRPGHWNECEVTFPRDYGHRDLAGRTASFRAVLHQVLTPVVLESLLELGTVRHPRYRLNDEMKELRGIDLNLYYAVLRDTSLHGLSQDMTEYLHLMEFQLGLGFWEDAWLMASGLQPDPALLIPAARLFRDSGLAARALEILDRLPGPGGGAASLRAQILFESGDYEAAEAVSAALEGGDDTELLELRANLAARAGLSLEVGLKRVEELMDARIRALLAEESGSRGCPMTLFPGQP